MMRGSSYQSTPAAATVILTAKKYYGRHQNKLIVVLAVSFSFSIFPFVGQVGIGLELPISYAKHITQLNQYKPSKALHSQAKLFYQEALEESAKGI